MPCMDAVVLGYCRIEENWELALKTVIYQTEVGDDTERLDKAHSKRPLLKASRHARIKAMKLLPKLLDRIKEGAEDMIEGIDTAESAAAQLQP
jgi:hypothetical protein